MPFPASVGKALDAQKSLAIRAGTGDHRFIAIWMVVVKGRVFVRSWEMGAGGWLRVFQKEPLGAIKIGSKAVAVRARRVKSEAMLKAVDRAYAAKYPWPSARHYIEGFARGRRRAATTELVPL